MHARTLGLDCISELTPSFRTRTVTFPESSLSHARTLGYERISEPTVEFQDAEGCFPESSSYPRTKRASSGVREYSFNTRCAETDLWRAERQCKPQRHVGMLVVWKSHGMELADRRSERQAAIETQRLGCLAQRVTER